MKNMVFVGIDGVLGDCVQGVFLGIPYDFRMAQAAIQLETGVVSSKQNAQTDRLTKIVLDKMYLSPDFYRILPVKNDAGQLWRGLKERFENIRVISSINCSEEYKENFVRIAHQKTQWFLKHIDPTFNPDHIIMTSMDKTAHLSASAHNILIDANVSVVNAWNRHLMRNANVFPHSGAGILHHGAEQTLAELERRGFKKVIQHQPNFTFSPLQDNQKKRV